MTWPRTRWCAVRGCPREGDRTVQWTGSAGESLLCEKHFQEYRRKFRKYMAGFAELKPNVRFADRKVTEPIAPGEQMGL